MTLSEYSRHRGVPPQTVLDAINAGRITRGIDGNIDPIKADEEWIANTDPSRVRTIERKRRHASIDLEAGKKRSAKATGKSRADAEALHPARFGKLTYSEARTMRENSLAQLAWADAQERLGNLLNRDNVVREIEKLHRASRDHLLRIPSRVSGQVASLTDITEIQNLIADEITAALYELCASLERIAGGNPQ